MQASNKARKHHTRIVPIRSAHEGWQDRAECAGQGPLMESVRGTEALKALSLCAACPVFDACQAWVADEPDFEGVAAGRIHQPRQARRSSVA